LARAELAGLDLTAFYLVRRVGKLCPEDRDLLRSMAMVFARQGRVKEAVAAQVADFKLSPPPREIGPTLEVYLDRYLNTAAVWGVVGLIGFLGVATAVLTALGYGSMSFGGSPGPIPSEDCSSAVRR
jgi:hypothetical protein